MKAGELIVLGRQLSKIGTTAMRDAQLPGGAVPAGISMVGADVLAHSPTSIGEIADRTGLRQSYVSESVARLRDQGVVETAPDSSDGRRTLVRFASGHPERVTMAASEPVDQALRDALGPGTDRETATAILAALTELAERIRPADRDPGPRGQDHRADATRAEATRADATRADLTRAEHTRAEHTRAEHTRLDITRANRPARRRPERGPGADGSIR